MKTRLLLILFACCLMIQPRAFAQDQPAAQPPEQPRGSSSVLPLNEDPNDPSASTQERMARQRKLIQRKINERNEAHKTAEATINERNEALKAAAVAQQKAEQERNDQMKKLIAALKDSTSTQALATNLGEILGIMYAQIESLRGQEVQRSGGNGSASVSVAAIAAKPLPKTYQAQAQVTVENGQKMDLLSYGEKEFSITAPLIVSPPKGIDMPNLVGSIGLQATFDSVTATEVLVQYQVTLEEPVLQTYNYGVGHDKKTASYGQMTSQFATRGKVTLKFGEPKEIARIGANVVKLTVTPDKN